MTIPRFSDELSLRVIDKDGKSFKIFYYKVYCGDGKVDYAFALPGKELLVKGFSGPIDALGVY